MVICCLPLCICCPTNLPVEQLPSHLRDIDLALLDDFAGYGASNPSYSQDRGGGNSTTIETDCVFCCCWKPIYEHEVRKKTEPSNWMNSFRMHLEPVPAKFATQFGSTEKEKFLRARESPNNPSGEVYFVRLLRDANSALQPEYDSVKEGAKLNSWFLMLCNDKATQCHFVCKVWCGSGGENNRRFALCLCPVSNADLAVGILGANQKLAYVDRRKNPEKVLYFKELRQRWERMYPREMAVAETEQGGTAQMETPLEQAPLQANMFGTPGTTAVQIGYPATPSTDVGDPVPGATADIHYPSAATPYVGAESTPASTNVGRNVVTLDAFRAVD